MRMRPSSTLLRPRDLLPGFFLRIPQHSNFITNKERRLHSGDWPRHARSRNALFSPPTAPPTRLGLVPAHWPRSREGAGPFSFATDPCATATEYAIAASFALGSAPGCRMDRRRPRRRANPGLPDGRGRGTDRASLGDWGTGRPVHQRKHGFRRCGSRQGQRP